MNTLARCFPTLILLLTVFTLNATAQSSMMDLRKKMQKRHAGQARSHLEQMETALNSGDAEGADKALAAAIAQGTLTQTQIDEARGRIQSAESQQRAAVVAAAQEKEAEQRRMAEQQAAAERQRQMASANSNAQSAGGGSTTAPTASNTPARTNETQGKMLPPATSSSATAKSTEAQRFAAKFGGGYFSFTCSRDSNAGKGRTPAWITLKDPQSDKEWEVNYSTPQFLNPNRGNTGGLTLNDESLVGARLEVHFNQTGEPKSIKNLGNGNHCPVHDWKVSGYGW